MKNKFTGAILSIILFLGIGIFLYPIVSDWWNDLYASKVIAEYAENVEHIDKNRYEDIWKAVEEFNWKLAKKSYSTYLTDKEWKEYNELLNVNDSGIMGYLEIDKLNIWLPIYHGTDESVLQEAAGHMEWTSLPANMKSCHCVIAAHSGLPSSQLFSKLYKLQNGDEFILHILNKELIYRVDQVETVVPDDISKLQIIGGENYCTLVTCTPYGVNTHRLLVRGELLDVSLQKKP